jgi:hypothetical protein
MASQAFFIGLLRAKAVFVVMLATVQNTVGAAGVAAASERSYSMRSRIRYVNIQNAAELSSTWVHIRPSLLTHVTLDGITKSTVISNMCQQSVGEHCGHLQLDGPSLLQLRGGGEDVEEDEEEDQGDVGEEDGDTVQDELEEEIEEKGESEDTSAIDTEESCVKGRRKGRSGAKTEKEIRAILLEHLRDLQESVGVKGRFVKDRVDPAAAQAEAAAAEEVEAAALLYTRTVVAGDALNTSEVSA